MNKPKLITLMAGLGLYLISTGISYAAFSYFNSSSSSSIIDPEIISMPTEEKRTRVDLTAPKTEVCPLNGQLYTEAEKNIWLTRRPLGVMIENHLDSRPQSGLSSADVVYEAVAEGGITRFMAVFLCGASAQDVQVGPVRSARTYFLDWISEYGIYPLYAHVGGANCNPTTGSGCQNGAKADALGQIRTYGWQAYNDINQFSVGFPYFWRDKERLGRPVAVEHTMYSTTDKLYEVAASRGLTHEDEEGQIWNETYIPWEFSEETPEQLGTSEPSYAFWNNQFEEDYNVSWEFDAENNQYLRSNGGKQHIDLNNEQPIAAKNVVVAFMDESKANDGYPNNLHLLYDNKGTGEAKVFKNGQVIDAEWTKKTRTDRTIFTDAESGEEIEFNPGLIWISILPTGKEVSY